MDVRKYYVISVEAEYSRLQWAVSYIFGERKYHLQMPVADPLRPDRELTVAFLVRQN